MRVSPVAWYYDSLEEVLLEAERSAAVTHSHPEGIKGAQAIAAAVYMARTHQSKEAIKGFVEERFGYDLDGRLDDIRIWYRFDATCQGSVPQAIISFLESEDFEDAVRNAVSLGGDSDTIACMAGAIAEAAYGIPDELIEIALDILDAPLRETVSRFYSEVLGVELLR
jgi:ADP-ribosylglycohydrolase